MTDLTRRIERLHHTILAGGDFHSLLTEILDQHGPSSYEQLLTMPELPESAGDSSYAITHAVEDLPDGRYVALLLGCAGKMSNTCPKFLHFLLGRAIASTTCFNALLKAVSNRDSATKAVVAKVVRLLKSEAEAEKLGEYEDKCTRLLGRLGG